MIEKPTVSGRLMNKLTKGYEESNWPMSPCRRHVEETPQQWGEMPVGMGNSGRRDRTFVWVSRQPILGGCVSDLDTVIPSRLSRYSRKRFLLPANSLLVATYPIRAMAGTKETRNRSESQEQDEVRIQPTPAQHPSLMLNRCSPNRIIIAQTMDKGRARGNQAGRRTQSTARPLIVLCSFIH